MKYLAEVAVTYPCMDDRLCFDARTYDMQPSQNGKPFPFLMGVFVVNMNHAYCYIYKQSAYSYSLLLVYKCPYLN